MSKYIIEEVIQKEINRVKEQRLTPLYISLNTKAFTDIYLAIKTYENFTNTKFPTSYFGLTLLYNPQQKCNVRIMCSAEQDMVLRKEKYL